MTSIRRRIIGFIVVAQLLINLVSGYWIARHTELEIEELFDAEQAQLARTIEKLLASGTLRDAISQDTIITDSDATHTPQNDHPIHPYERKISYQVWDTNNTLILKSNNAPSQRLGTPKSGFSQWRTEGIVWNVFGLYAPAHKRWIYTAQSTAARTELIRLITQDQILAAVVGNLAVLVVVILGVFYGTRPIVKLSQELLRRDDQNLHPIDLPVARELQPIRSSVNRLLARIDEALLNEKSFNEDLAHELRTPLAAIKIHAQTLELQETLGPVGKQTLSRMISGISNISDTIEQLLQLSRLSGEKQVVLKTRVDLLAMARAVLIHLPHTVHRDYEISLEGDPCFISGNETLLSIMLRNLIDNATKYSDAGASIHITCEKSAHACILSVADEGPGMTDQQKINSTKRRYRVSDNQAYGSGLGLAIVQKIASLHNAALSFHDQTQGTGLIVKIKFELNAQLE